MRKLQIILIAILFALPIMGRAESVVFFKGTVYQALDEARAQNKLLLVEFYASWSHKSRWMHEVLSKSDVGQWFVVVSVDTHTEDGAALATQYQVSDYPAILVSNTGGVVLDKIDRALEVVDFVSRLNTVRLSTDRQSVRQLQQIFTLSESNDSATREKVNEMVVSYIATQDVETLTSQSLWDMFTTPSITYYGSASYDFLIRNVDHFFSPVEAKSLINLIVLDVVTPYVIGSLPFDEAEVVNVESDSLSLAHCAAARDLCLLARLREAKDASRFILLLPDVVKNVGEDLEFQIVMSLDFIADITTVEDRSIRNTARRMLEKLKQKTASPAKTTLIDSLLAKFS